MDKQRVVFIHLPGQATAVPAGRLEMDVDAAGEFMHARFAYGTHYLQRGNALDVDPVALPRQGAPLKTFTPPNGLGMFGAIRDAAPDAWGRRVIENRLRKTGPLPEWEYLDQAGADRAGALDIRPTAASESVRTLLPAVIDLAHLLDAAERIEAGETVPAHLMHCFEGGPTMGGMRPKAVIVRDGRQYVAKFPARRDRFDVPAVEHATLELARLAGLNVPATDLVTLADGRRVLLIERFDREPLGQGEQARRHMVTALTMLGLHEMQSPDASYADIAEAISRHGVASAIASDRAELFGRMVFNIFVHNDDDHLRNHSFLYDTAGGWVLSPLYDVVPAPAIGTERFLHLGVGPMGRAARLDNAFQGAGQFKLKDTEALAIIDRIHRVVREWRGTFEQCGVTTKDCDAVASAMLHARQLGGQSLGL